jgi:hypothetical protein
MRDIKNVGQMDTIRYLQTDFPTAILGSEELEIEVKSIGINAKVRIALSFIFLARRLVLMFHPGLLCSLW